LVNNGCEGSTAVLARKVALKPGTTEVLFNDSDRMIGIDRQHVLDLRLSDPISHTLTANIWSTTGGKATLNLRRLDIPDTQLRFVAELGTDRTARKLHFLSMDIVLPLNSPVGETVDARLCTPAIGIRQHVSAQ
jgi:hypothetical protein